MFQSNLDSANLTYDDLGEPRNVPEFLEGHSVVSRVQSNYTRQEVTLKWTKVFLDVSWKNEHLKPYLQMDDMLAVDNWLEYGIIVMTVLVSLIRKCPVRQTPSYSGSETGTNTETQPLLYGYPYVQVKSVGYIRFLVCRGWIYAPLVLFAIFTAFTWIGWGAWAVTPIIDRSQCRWTLMPTKNKILHIQGTAEWRSHCKVWARFLQEKMIDPSNAQSVSLKVHQSKNKCYEDVLKELRLDVERGGVPKPVYALLTIMILLTLLSFIINIIALRRVKIGANLDERVAIVGKAVFAIGLIQLYFSCLLFFPDRTVGLFQRAVFRPPCETVGNVALVASNYRFWSIMNRMAWQRFLFDIGAMVFSLSLLTYS